MTGNQHLDTFQGCKLCGKDVDGSPFKAVLSIQFLVADADASAAGSWSQNAVAADEADATTS